VLRRWWPALAGVAFLVAGIGFLAVYSLVRDDRPSGPGDVVSAVPMVAQLADESGGSGAAGVVELELNNATGEVCYRVAAADLAYPFALVLTSGAGGDAALLNLGVHNSGTMGCALGGLTRTQAVLASPETYHAEVQLPDGLTLRGQLVYNPTSGDVEVAASPSTETTAAPVGTGANRAGFILPDTVSSSRWEEFDRPLIQAACESAGIECLIENAEGDAENMAAIADRMIAEGVAVLAIANLDPESGAAIQQRAAAAGVHNIDYDRLTLGGAADVYVSFDNTAVGTAQGQGLIQCLGGETEGRRIIQLHGSPTDNNATLFREGYQEAIAGAGFDTVGEEVVPEWDSTEARVIFEELLDSAGGSIDGVLAANDGLALAAQSVLSENDLTVPVTGQDATVEGLRAILEGTQCMTVYKPVKVEADAVVAAAVALMRGVDPPANATIDNGNAEIPFVQGQVTSIFFEDVRIPILDGFVDRDDVCSGIEDICLEAGISEG
jgi:D-xylose transport system substrate-binding protein